MVAAGTHHDKEGNHYETLGIPRSASAKAIRHAYVRQAKLHHPDRYAALSSTNTNKTGSTKQSSKLCTREKEAVAAAERFCRLQRAYEVLRNNETRAAYDATLPPFLPTHQRHANTFNSQRTGPSSPFGQYDDFDRMFREQVERVRREKEDAWRSMQTQRARMKYNNPLGSEGLSGLFSHRRKKQAATPTTAEAAASASALPHALLRAMPLLLLPCLLLYGVYRQAKLRKEELASEALYYAPTLIHDELGRAYMMDSKGRRYRVVEYDGRGPPRTRSLSSPPQPPPSH